MKEKGDLNGLKKTFRNQLLKWDKDENTRKMPWKGEKDAYKIWLSEIILQQTRVEQGLSYYNNFIKTCRIRRRNISTTIWYKRSGCLKSCVRIITIQPVLMTPIPIFR